MYINKILYKIGILYCNLLKVFLSSKPTQNNTTDDSNSIFLITSTINFINIDNGKKIIKSYVTPNERFKQTINTINSIRSKNMNAYIVLLENSILNLNQFIILKKLVNELKCYNSNNIIQKYFNKHLNKGLPELLMIIKYLHTHNLYKYRNIYKISGRYYLNDNYNAQTFNQNKFIFIQSSGILSTRFYYVPQCHLKLYKLILIISIIPAYLGVSIESIFTKTISIDYINLINKIGVSGQIAGSLNEFINE